MKLHKNMNNQEITSLLRAVAAALEVKGESPFRIRAYDNAADSVEHASREVKDLWEEGKLRELPGIGANIASHLDELFKTGKAKHFSSLFSSLPEAMFELLEVPGIGPKTAYKLSKTLKISKPARAVERLKEAANKGLIRNIEGFGEESEAAIIKGIEEYQRREYRMLLPTALQLAEEMVSYMEKEKAVLRIDPLGSLRRRAPTIGDLDLAVATTNPAKVIDHFKKFPLAKKVLAAGENTARIIHRSGRQIDIKTQEPSRYGSMLQHFTGSKKHNIHLREIAMEKGLSLSEHGIKKKGKLRKYADEKQFYKALGMDWIPPELREDTGEIEAAQKHALPILIRADQIRGDLHLHTNYDWQSSHDAGVNTPKEMINKAIELNYEYIGIGDHNPSTRAYSDRKLITEVKKRSKYIEQIKSSIKSRDQNRTIIILNSLEVDILADGKLSLPNEAMDLLDYAVVSVHSSLRMSREKMTKRVIKGLTHPKAKILGHPTGRLLNKREGYELDWEKVFKFVRQENKFLEINAWPTRLDLADTLVRRAISYGIKLAINTDSHSKKHLDFMHYGVDVARRGWAQPRDIINALPFKTLKKLLLQK
jgi:DNA polymerase (family 10)